MSLHIGKEKIRVPKVEKRTTNKIPKAFFDAGGKFKDMSSVTSMDGWWNKEDTADMTSMRNMFASCYSLTSVPAMDTSKVTDMNGMFQSCSKLTSVPAMDTSKVTSMGSMFYSCSKLTSVPAMDTSKVTSMFAMFSSCSKLTSVPAMDTSNVAYMGSMFSSCSSLAEIHMYGMKVSFDISASTKFTREALVEILNNLATITSSQTLTMGSTNLAKLTDDDKLIATNKGWTLA